MLKKIRDITEERLKDAKRLKQVKVRKKMIRMEEGQVYNSGEVLVRIIAGNEFF